jgi:hypothetical protein
MMGILCVCFVDLKFKMTTKKNQECFIADILSPVGKKKNPNCTLIDQIVVLFWFYGFCIDRKSKMAAKADHVFGIEPNADGKMF